MWRLFALWLGVTAVIVAMALSDFLFGNRDPRRLGLRVLLAFAWPIAALSRSGRDILFNLGKGL